MADELIQAGIFEGMTWWNTNPAKNFFPSGGLSPPPYCSMAAGVDALASTWAVADHQIINSNMAVLGCTASNRSSSTFFDQGPPVADSSSLQSMEFHPSPWNPQDIIGGDYNTTTVMQVGEWSDLNCGSSPPNSGTDGSTVTCDGQIPAPVDPTSMFPSNLINSDHEILPPCDWNNGTQAMGSSFNQQQQQIINHIRATLLGGSPCSSSPPSPKAQSRKRTTNSKGNKNEEGSDSGGEPTFKRQRIETPSSLPTFKVRKEKLGDRITALQQLVSPFGKTDTASVLHEAIEYIKFLHDQVNEKWSTYSSTPYRKNGAPIQPHHQQQKSRLKGEAATSEDLRSRGLCLVPIASTFPVAHESPADFWTPTFGASSFR